MNVDQCRATVFLHEPLRQSLATWLGGKEVASMQRCALNGGHRGEHLGSPDAEGKALVSLGRMWSPHRVGPGATERAVRVMARISIHRTSGGIHGNVHDNAASLEAAMPLMPTHPTNRIGDHKPRRYGR